MRKYQNISLNNQFLIEAQNDLICPKCHEKLEVAIYIGQIYYACRAIACSSISINYFNEINYLDSKLFGLEIDYSYSIQNKSKFLMLAYNIDNNKHLLFIDDTESVVNFTIDLLNLHEVDNYLETIKFFS